MAALAHPLTDSHGSLGRLAAKFFTFASVADGVGHDVAVIGAPERDLYVSHRTGERIAVGIGASTSGVTALTFEVGATAGGTLIVWGTGV